MTCNDCFYAGLCCPEENIACTDFKDKHKIVEFKYLPGDKAFAIAGESIPQVVVTRCHASMFDDKDQPMISYWYNVMLGGESVERRWRDWHDDAKFHPLYRTFSEAYLALVGESDK